MAQQLQVDNPPEPQGGVKSLKGYCRVTAVTRVDVSDATYSRLVCDLQFNGAQGNEKPFNKFLLAHHQNSGVAGTPIYVQRHAQSGKTIVAGKAFAFQNNQIYQLTLTMDGTKYIVGKYVVTGAAKKQ